MITFQRIMRENEKFKRMERGQVIWDALREMDRSRKMPADFYQEWK
jgi:hypothetical protein